MLEARHQIFNGLHPAPFIEDLSLGLNDALLGGLALPANVIYLLLQGAAVGNLMVQRGLKCLALPFNAALSAWAVATCSRSVSLESRAAFSSPDKVSMIARSGATAAATASAAARPSASALTVGAARVPFADQQRATRSVRKLLLQGCHFGCAWATSRIWPSMRQRWHYAGPVARPPADTSATLLGMATRLLPVAKVNGKR
jgi:hypothetical protein